MIRSGFLSSAQIDELKGILRTPTEYYGVGRRANALLLLNKGMSCEEVAEVLYIDDDTVRGWFKDYQSGGLEGLSTFNWKGSKSHLTSAEIKKLGDWLEENCCRNTNEIRHHIHMNYGVYYSRPGCIKLLHRLEFEYRKPKALPNVASEEAQQEHIDLYKDLQRNLPENETVYFLDAAHLEHQTRPAYAWIKRGSNMSVQTTSGRKRNHVQAAMRLEDFHTPFVAPATVNGCSTVQLLAMLEALNPDKRVIHVIWDNAGYHKGPDVRAFLARPECRIRLIKLPPYCPHLNPIERLWGVLHQHVTHNRYYPTEKEFSDAIFTFLRETIPKEWKTFRDQVSDNFRVISTQNFRVLK